MSKLLLVGMSTYRIVSRHETMEEADAAKEAFSGASNIVELGGDWSGFTGVDLMRVHNALVPEADRIKRFSDRPTAVKRVNAMLLNGNGAEPPAPETQDPKQPQETPMSARTHSARSKREKATPRDDVRVILTAEGRKDKLRFNEGSARGKVFDTIKRTSDGAIAIADLVKRCSNFAKRGQVLGCVDKLRIKGYVKTN